VILRPCWFYGPQQPARQTRFFSMIRKGNPIIFGSGENLRSMSYVDNSCPGILLATESARANGQTYWIADERPYTTNEIYRTVAELLDVPVFKPRHIPAISSDICLFIDKGLQSLGLYEMNFHVAAEMTRDIACTVEKAKAELGYAPQIDLREGMRRSIAWCRAKGLI
jgi:nucleoside-diphosphate-sugar epimerase